MKTSVVLSALALTAVAANAATIVSGTYALANHPDGNAQPPQYGLRLDELYNATGSHDIYTFDFNHASSNMKMDVNLVANTIRIYGTTYGGRDIGGGYAVDLDAGAYTIDFLYNVGVSGVPGDDDVWANAASASNFGTITTARGDVIRLEDKSDGNYLFRLGDENNDAGHRGFAGISGWGWLTHGPAGSAHVNASDWLFTATLIPAPSSLALLGLGGLVAGRRRR